MEGAGREAKWVGGQLYELRDTALYCGGQPTGLEGLTNFEIVTDGRQTVALTLLPSGFTCELFGSYYDAGSGAWGALVQLTGYGKYIRNYSAVLDESGKIVAALNLVSVNADAQQVYDNRSAQLVVLDDCGYNDLVVSDWLSYDDARVAPGALRRLQDAAPKAHGAAEGNCKLHGAGNAVQQRRGKSRRAPAAKGIQRANAAQCAANSADQKNTTFPY